MNMPPKQYLWNEETTRRLGEECISEEFKAEMVQADICWGDKIKLTHKNLENTNKGMSRGRQRRGCKRWIGVEMRKLGVAEEDETDSQRSRRLEKGYFIDPNKKKKNKRSSSRKTIMRRGALLLRASCCNHYTVNLDLLLFTSRQEHNSQLCLPVFRPLGVAQFQKGD